MATRIGLKAALWKKCLKGSFSKDFSVNIDSKVPISTPVDTSKGLLNSPLRVRDANIKTLPVTSSAMQRCLCIPCSMINSSNVNSPVSMVEFLKPHFRSYATDSPYSVNEKHSPKTDTKKSDDADNSTKDLPEAGASGGGILSAMFEKNEQQKQGAENDAKVVVENIETNSEQKSNQQKENSDKEAESAFLRSQRYAKWFLLGSVAIVTPIFIFRNGKYFCYGMFSSLHYGCFQYCL